MELDRPLQILDKGRQRYYPNKADIGCLKQELNKDDVAKLRVTVISVSGAMRTGKSTLLNFLLRALRWLEDGKRLDDSEWLTSEAELNGFSWRDGPDPETVGVLVWSHPFRIIDPDDGQPRVVLLMDTQGSFDHMAGRQDCAAVFAFSTMFASTQILNVKGNLDENVFDYLTAFTAFGLHAKPDFRIYQHLVLLIRDWDLNDDLGFGGGRRLLERKLQEGEAIHPEARQRRRRLKQSFHLVECCLFPSPGRSAARGNWAIKNVDKEFQDNLHGFVRNSTLFRDKLLGDRTLSCAELVDHMIALLAVFDRSSMPTSGDIVQVMTDRSNVMVLEEAIATYRREFPLRAAELGPDEADSRLRYQLMLQLFEQVADNDEGAKRANLGERLRNSLDEILREARMPYFEADNERLVEEAVKGFMQDVMHLNSNSSIEDVKSAIEGARVQATDNLEQKLRGGSELKRAGRQQLKKRMIAALEEFSKGNNGKSLQDRVDRQSHPTDRHHQSQSLSNVIGQWVEIGSNGTTLNVCIKNQSDASLKLMRSTFKADIKSHKPEDVNLQQELRFGMRSLNESSFECGWSWRDDVTIDVTGRAHFSGLFVKTLDGRLEAKIFKRGEQVGTETVLLGRSGSIMGPNGLKLLLHCALDYRRVLWDITVLNTGR